MQKQVYIDNNPTTYYITDDGQLYNSKTKRWYKGRISDTGYLDYILRIDNKQIAKRAHRLVAEAFLDNPNNLPIVNHKDGNKLNNNVNNLEWVTQSDNTIHAIKTGLKKKTYTVIKYDGDLEGEVWKEIFNSDKYKVSNLGRVLNTKTNRILAGKKAGEYIRYELTYDGVRKTYLAHRLVYLAFHPEFDIFNTEKIINHIDGNKSNNNIKNLEECSKSENVLHSYYVTKTNTKARPILQYDLNMNFIQEFNSANQVERILGIKQDLITSACQRNGTSHGFYWKYKY